MHIVELGISPESGNVFVLDRFPTFTGMMAVATTSVVGVGDLRYVFVGKFPVHSVYHRAELACVDSSLGPLAWSACVRVG
ncbi:MAG: hypothetical protein HY574_01895 [candidate division NC10 bacterium]|nr:hypothetical protein [candidate division NC10 bacterium]